MGSEMCIRDRDDWESIGVVVLSLGFAGIERRGERPLEAFYLRQKRKHSPDGHQTKRNTAQLTAKAHSEPRVSTPPRSHTEIEWQCPACDARIQVPIFDDPDDGDERSDETLLCRLRVEHEDWHMALSLS